MGGKEGFLHAFGYSRRNLIAIGLWPNQKDLKYREIWSSIRFVSSIVIMLLTINIVQTIKLVTIWGDLDATSDIISTADLPIGLVVLKMLVFVGYRKEVFRLLSFVKVDWNIPRNSSELEHMISRARMARMLSVACVTIGFTALTCYLILRIGQEMGLVSGKTEFRLPLFEGYFPFNYRPSPIYEFVWFMQYLGASIATIGYSGMYGLFVALMLHICGQFAILRDRLEILINFKINEKEFHATLVQIVERLDFLNRCVFVIDDVFNFMFFCEIFACTLEFCLQGFLLIVSAMNSTSGLPLLKTLFLLLFVAHIGIHLFICCYVAEKFQEENESLFRAAYNCKWYNLPPKQSVLLIMIMLRTSKPIQITAGKFFVFSLSLYAQIFKTSGGYVSMLLAVRNRLTNT